MSEQKILAVRLSGDEMHARILNAKVSEIFRLGCPKRPRELLGWSNGPEGNGARPRIPVTASAILWWLWHTSWSCFDRGPIVAAGPSRTLRHDGHGYPSRQWYELSQDVPAM